MYLKLLAISTLVWVALCNEGPDASLQEKSPVYFPILPEDFEGFGIKLGGGGSAEDFRLGSGKKLDMPVTTAKPTTTTDKLPINPQGILSHVALEAVTEPPGPSYLTDSYYYLDDHTPIPGSVEDDSGEHHHFDISLLLDRESENLGEQVLQNLSPVREQSFGEKRPTALAFTAPRPPRPSSRRPSTRPPSRLTTPKPTTTTRSSTRSSARSTTPKPTTTTKIPIRSTPAAPVSIIIPSSPEKSMKLRPAFTPIPTPAPAYHSPPSRSPSRTPSRTSRPTKPPKQSYGAPERVSSRRPSFESSRIAKPQGSRQVSRRPTVASKSQVSRRPTVAPKSTYRTPTPPTVPKTTTTSRSYGERAQSGSAPRRQYLSAVTNSPGESPVYRTSTKAYRAPSSLFHIRGASTTVTAPAQPDFVQSDPNIYVPLEYDEEAIPGEAGVDYPNYSIVPDTSFTCNAQEHPGLYADTEAKCQTFHICQEDGRQDSFLCPNGTVFNQQYFVCDWWYNFSCDHADRFYSLNAFIYELPDSTKYAKK